jgi:F0F1-type ATP synthase membrane subunit b/b'
VPFAAIAAALVVVLVAADAALAGGGGHPSADQTLRLRIIQFLGFGIVAVLLAVYAFPVAGKLLRERAERIARDFEGVDDGKAAATKAREAAEKALGEFEKTTTQALEEATREGAELRDTIVAEADALAAKIGKKGRMEAEVEQAKTLLEAENVFTRTAFEAAREVLGGAVDRATHDRLVERFLADLDGMKV